MTRKDLSYRVARVHQRGRRGNSGLFVSPGSIEGRVCQQALLTGVYFWGMKAVGHASHASINAADAATQVVSCHDRLIEGRLVNRRPFASASVVDGRLFLGLSMAGSMKAVAHASHASINAAAAATEVVSCHQVDRRAFASASVVGGR